jgi:beta-lactam-binding protein with PASTA domain
MKLWKFLIVLGIVGAVAAVLVAGINFLVLPSLVHSNEEVAVPDLRGASPQAAADLLRPLDLEVVVLRTSAHANMGAGLISDQVPAPDAGIRKGRVVKVVVSSGPATTGLTDLVGLSERQAGITLQRDSFQLGRVSRMQKEGLSEPQVVAQHPQPGTKLNKGAVVDLVVAEPGPRIHFMMPDLRGVPLFKARQLIDAAGLLMGEVDTERHAGAADNTIMEQRPRAGARVAKGEVVDVLVSSR